MTKRQTPAQRIANPVWLRGEIAGLIEDCAAHIEEDQELADKACEDDTSGWFLARVSVHHHWKRQLERILRGKTSTEDLQAFLKREGVCP